MSNKENLPTQAASQRNRHHCLESSKPLDHTRLSDSIPPQRQWQQQQQQHPHRSLPIPSPPYIIHSSSNSKPAPRSQRDHSDRNSHDSPLQVRKTRENLPRPHHARYADVPPPCPQDFHSRTPEHQWRREHSSLHLSVTDDGEDIHYEGRDGFPRHSLAALHNPDSIIVHAPSAEVSASSRVVRRLSISRSMLSKVKGEIAQRSRSFQSIRAAGSEANVMRRLSGKGKQDTIQDERSDGCGVNSSSAAGSVASSNGSSLVLSLNKVDASRRTLTPPSTSGGQLRAHSPVGTPSVGHESPTRARPRSPTPDPTPRAAPPNLYKYLPLPPTKITQHIVSVPYISLTVTPDLDSLDVNLEGDIWVLAEVQVRSNHISIHSSGEDSPTTTPDPLTPPINAISIIDLDMMQSSSLALALTCLEHLVSTLLVDGDMLAALYVTSRPSSRHSSVHEHFCVYMHPLTAVHDIPNLYHTLATDLLHFDKMLHAIFAAQPLLPLSHALRSFLHRPAHAAAVNFFVLSEHPCPLVKVLASHGCRTHEIQLGTITSSLDRSPSPASTSSTPPAPSSWAISIPSTLDATPALFTDMLSAIRHSPTTAGTISSLRLCFKPRPSCRVLEVFGQKSAKHLRLGQKCSLGIRVRVPALATRERSHSNTTNNSTTSLETADSLTCQAALFIDLAAFLGTLTSEILLIEARYRSSMLPAQNVLSVRQVCVVRRPDAASAWCRDDGGSRLSTPSSQMQVQERIARCVSTQYPPEMAARIIARHFLMSASCVGRHVTARSLRSDVSEGSHRTQLPSPASTEQCAAAATLDKPPSKLAPLNTLPHDYAQPSSTPRLSSFLAWSTSTSSTESHDQDKDPRHQSHPPHDHHPQSTAYPSPSHLTFNLPPPSFPSPTPSSSTADDAAARKIWRHIRCSSSSFAAQYADAVKSREDSGETEIDAGEGNVGVVGGMQAQQQQQVGLLVEAIDDSEAAVRALRHQALLNKRSVGAETLRDWRWERERERVRSGGGGGGSEAPWL